jgi:peptide-methionine (S)-S-oxide reductase
VQKIGLGGGCHWCTEAIFQSIKGVSNVEQGWISAKRPYATSQSEAVIVHFDTSIITLDTLIEIHLFTHNATSNHTFRQKYRSAVYVFTKQQEVKAQTILDHKQKLFKKSLVTKVYDFSAFILNDTQYLNYYKSNPKKPFCQVRIEPKLKMLCMKYAKFIAKQ